MSYDDAMKKYIRVKAIMKEVNQTDELLVSQPIESSELELCSNLK